MSFTRVPATIPQGRALGSYSGGASTLHRVFPPEKRKGSHPPGPFFLTRAVVGAPRLVRLSGRHSQRTAKADVDRITSNLRSIRRQQWPRLSKPRSPFSRPTTARLKICSRRQKRRATRRVRKPWCEKSASSSWFILRSKRRYFTRPAKARSRMRTSSRRLMLSTMGRRF